MRAIEVDIAAGRARFVVTLGLPSCSALHKIRSFGAIWLTVNPITDVPIVTLYVDDMERPGHPVWSLAGPRDIVSRLGITHVFHFTDVENLVSIRAHGLLSLRELSRLNIEVRKYASDNDSRGIDQYCDLDQYVRLCFWDQHPMEYLARKEGRITNSTFLAIDPDVLRMDGVRYADGIAYAQDTTIYDDLDAAEAALDFEVIYTRTNWNDEAVQKRLQKSRKYEILVPNRVRPELIRGL